MIAFSSDEPTPSSPANAGAVASDHGHGRTTPREGSLDASWPNWVRQTHLSGEFEAEGGHIALFLSAPPVPPALDGLRLRLCLGETSLLSVPLVARGEAVEFGPTRLAFQEALHLAGPRPRLRLDGFPPGHALPPGTLKGAPLEALSLPDEAVFFAKVQLNHSRYADKRLLRLGAKAGFQRFRGFAARAAGLTILAHRILEQDLRKLTAQDHAEAHWLRTHGREVVQEGLRQLAETSPQWATVRWTTSLAMVCGLLSLCQDDPEEAGFFFGAATDQTHLVHVAPVAAANLMSACFIQGVLHGVAGRIEEARTLFERGVRAFQPCVAAQDVMANVWVIGDMISVGRAARMCFIALARFGLLETGGAPRIHEGTRLDPGQILVPFAKILAAGLCPSVRAGIAAIQPTE